MFIEIDVVGIIYLFICISFFFINKNFFVGEI